MVGWHHRLSGQGLSKLRDTVKDREAWHAAIHEVTRLSDYTKTTTLQTQKLRWKRCKICPVIPLTQNQDFNIANLAPKTVLLFFTYFYFFGHTSRLAGPKFSHRALFRENTES